MGSVRDTVRDRHLPSAATLTQLFLDFWVMCKWAVLCCHKPSPRKTSKQARLSEESVGRQVKTLIQIEET